MGSTRVQRALLEIAFFHVVEKDGALEEMEKNVPCDYCRSWGTTIDGDGEVKLGRSDAKRNG